jgi:hypothetical protein
MCSRNSMNNKILWLYLVCWELVSLCFAGGGIVSTLTPAKARSNAGLFRFCADLTALH